MKFPALIRKSMCKTPVNLTIYGEGLTEVGSPEVIYQRDNLYPSDSLYPTDNLYGDPIFCNFQNSAKTVYTDKQKKVIAIGKLLFNGDLIPDCPTISGGFVIVDGIKRNIISATKARNPDGTVNFTEIDIE